MSDDATSDEDHSAHYSSDELPVMLNTNLNRLNRRVWPSKTASPATLGTSLSLFYITCDGIVSVLSSPAMSSPEGARGLALMARSCRMLGLKGQLDNLFNASAEPSIVVKIAQQFCKAIGVQRRPETVGDGWCWPRMLSWLSQAVRVGAQCELKTITAGIAAALRTRGAFGDTNGSLVLVEPGVYEEQLVIVSRGQRVSIWRCDRESESNKEEMQKAQWRSQNEGILRVSRDSIVSINGFHVTATKVRGANNGAYNCISANNGGALSVELCDLECDNLAVIAARGPGTTAVVSCCCIHNGNDAGVLVSGKATATLVNNHIHCNINAGVAVRDEGTKVMLRGNRIHDGKSIGVAVISSAKCTLDDNDIRSNSLIGVAVLNEGSEAILIGNQICDGRGVGIRVDNKAKATLKNNMIVANDLSGISVNGLSTATLTGNTIKGNGQCNIERTEEELEIWPPAAIAAYRSTGFPGVKIRERSSVIMRHGSNIIEGNGKGSDAVQVLADRTSRNHVTPHCVLVFLVAAYVIYRAA